MRARADAVVDRCFQTVPSGITVQSAPIQGVRAGDSEIARHFITFSKIRSVGATEGSSPSGALVESTVSESGGHASLAVACGWRGGGQGVHREVESEGFEEQYLAVIEGAIP